MSYIMEHYGDFIKAGICVLGMLILVIAFFFGGAITEFLNAYISTIC